MMIKHAYVRPYFLMGILLLLTGFKIQAQTAGANMKTSNVIELYDDEGKPMSTPNRKNVAGSPMLNPEWGSGTIFFQSGKVVPLMEVQLNLQKNELYFKREGKPFKFSDSVVGFRVIYAIQNQVYNDIFHSGYPVTGRNKETYFYQLLVDGKQIQLIADRSRQLVDAYTYTGGEKSAYRDDEVLYVFDAANQRMFEIKNLKHAKDIIIAAFPDRKKDIEQICTEQKLGLKTREDLIALVQALQ
jgi:hypothetical protein